MYNVDWLSLVSGLNTGILVVVLLLLFGPVRPDKDKAADKSTRKPPTLGGPPSEIVNIAMSMSQLCSAVHNLNPEWRTIEITRQGDNNAAMRVVSADGQEVDPTKLH